MFALCSLFFVVTGVYSAAFSECAPTAVSYPNQRCRARMRRRVSPFFTHFVSGFMRSIALVPSLCQAGVGRAYISCTPLQRCGHSDRNPRE